MVAMRDIQEFSERIAREFKPRRIILFGSYACGRPNEDSDVDILVILPGKGDAGDKSLEIRRRLRPRFPLDLLTRTAAEVERRLALNDWFLHDVIEKGRVLHESSDARVDQES